MKTHWAFCSACDRQVEVAVRPVGRDPETGESLDALVCLEVGHTCTGALCPITDVPPEEMREALDRLRAGQPDSDTEE
jgi:hypothetical protein